MQNQLRLLFVAVSILLSSAFVYATDATLSQELDSIRTSYNIPAMASMSYHKDVASQIAVSGIRKINDETLLESTDKFHLGSITKSMTATLVGMYIEEGKLTWVTTLKELFPDVSIHPELESVTIEMLLAHRSGLPRGLKLDEEQLKKVAPEFKRNLTIPLVLSNPPLNKPGSSYHYSNIGYVVLGHILERLSQTSWEKIITERLFKPLKMNACGFGFPGNKVSIKPDQPWGHYLDDQKQVISSSSDNIPFWGPAGTVHCPINELNKYFFMHINGFNGISGLLKTQTFNKLHTQYPGQSYTYGGWIRLERKWAKGPVLTHSGTNELNMAYVWLAPILESSFFGFANIGGDDAASAIDQAITVMIKSLPVEGKTRFPPIERRY